MLISNLIIGDYNYAQMMELVDMLDSKSGVCKDVWVRVPLWVVKRKLRLVNTQNKYQKKDRQTPILFL